MDRPTWSPKQRRAIELLATPGERSLEDVSAEVGIGRNTLWRWRQDRAFNEAVADLAKQTILRSSLSRVYDALVRQAAKGNTRAIEILLTHVDGYTTRIKSESHAEVEAEVNVRDEELARRLAEDPAAAEALAAAFDRLHPAGGLEGAGPT